MGSHPGLCHLQENLVFPVAARSFRPAHAFGILGTFPARPCRPGFSP